MKEVQKHLSSLLVPVLFVVILWVIKIIENLLHLDLATLGIFPLSLTGIKGILFAPMIHGDYQHLLSNSLPLIVLGWALFYFYPTLGLSVTGLSWLISGIWIWVFARPSYHIGASTIIYSWAAFLFVSGMLRSHPRLMALSLLVTFLYGSMIWGIFPLKVQISWEGHLMGLLSGVILAYFFRETGPQRKKYSWETEEESEEEYDQPPYWMSPGKDDGSHQTEDPK